MSQTPETPATNPEAVTMCANCPEKGSVQDEISPEDWTLHLSYYANGELIGPSGINTTEVTAFADLGFEDEEADDPRLTVGSGFGLRNTDGGPIFDTIRQAEEAGVALEPDINLRMGELVCARIKDCKGPIKEPSIDGLPVVAPNDDGEPRLVCGGYNRAVLLDFLRDRLAALQAENPPTEQ